MNSHKPTRKEAFDLLKKYNSKPGLIRHALAVEAVMGHFAARFGEDFDAWKIVGLVHDIDYEMYPDQHCVKCVQLFEDLHWPPEYIRAVVSHGWGICSEVKPETRMEKTLYAIDKLTGLVSSAALVRPSKSILDIKAKSVKKKFKDKRFAAAVDRTVIQKGADFLDMDLSEVIMGMRPVAEEIGLKGTL
ncbi:MAG: HDIG domain-containing protein [Desulfobacter sp.]|nr:HDIG domain-containing protein [Desulfobacter sp.]WDP84726.1 MAG: HDIG domain-containing protein [Desulfobacter sp.]